MVRRSAARDTRIVLFFVSLGCLVGGAYGLAGLTGAAVTLGAFIFVSLLRR